MPRPWFDAIRLLLLPLAALPLYLTAAPASLTLYTEHFPPYSFLQQQQVKGINADLLRLACERAAIQCEFVLYPWLRAFELAQKNPHSGIFSIVRTPKRAPLFQWLGPLASSKAYLYRLKRRPEIKLQQLSDAKAYSIGVAHGDIYEEFFLSQGFVHGKNLVKFSTKSEPVPLFLKGKIDLLIASELMLSNWLPQPNTVAEVEVVLDISDVGQNFLALHPAVPAATAQALQQALTELTAEGQLQQLVQNYQQQPIPGP
jgi:polar amino acid transport system substrate-binding protein